MVLNDGPIQKIEDLKGKVVATNAEGSGVDVAMRAMLRKHGLEANRDYTVVEAPFPAMKSMLAEKKVDLIPAVLPFSLRSRTEENRARRCSCKRDAIGVTAHGRDVAGAQAVHRRAPRRAGRFSRRHAAHHALVCRSEEPRGRDAISSAQLTKQPPSDLRLAVHQDATTITTRICCRTSTRCRRTST